MVRKSRFAQSVTHQKPRLEDAFISDRIYHADGSIAESYHDFYNALDLNTLSYDTLYIVAGDLSACGYAYYIPNLLAAAYSGNGNSVDAVLALEVAISARSNRNKKELLQLSTYLESLSEIEQTLLINDLINLTGKYDVPFLENEILTLINVLEIEDLKDC